MLTKFLTAVSLGATIAVIPIATAYADRDPSNSEYRKLSRKLQRMGYVTWDDIELDDDGYWDVDDAVARNGTKWDIRLSPRRLRVLSVRPD